MRFEFSAENWHFVIEVNSTPNYRPDGKFGNVNPSDLQAWREGHVGFYEVIIVSKKLDQSSDSELIHIAQGVLLPTEPDDLQEELECALDQDGFLEHILNHWELEDSKLGPVWRKG